MRTSTLHGSPRRWPARAAFAAACVLLAGCTPGARGGNASEPVFLPWARYEFYDVEGTTALELLASIRRERPPSERYFARTAWNVTWRAEWNGNPCRVRWTDIRATIVVTMPRWKAPPDAPPGLVEDWNEMIRALSIHEAGHVENAREAEREVRRALMGVTAPSCNMMTLRTRQAAQWVIDGARLRDRRYDERTRHGRTQGAVWPPGAPADSATADSATVAG